MSSKSEQVFKALADAQRRNILKLLRRGEVPAGTIAQSLSLTPATVSHHLSLLRSADLVRVRRQGQLRIYALNTSVVEEVMLMFSDLLRPREEADDS